MDTFSHWAHVEWTHFHTGLMWSGHIFIHYRSCVPLRDLQLQVAGNYSYWFNLSINICKLRCLDAHFILNLDDQQQFGRQIKHIEKDSSRDSRGQQNKE